MATKNIKLFIGITITLAYIGIGVFGLFEFSHAKEMPMVNCPYAENSFAVCNNSLDHINNWQQFSNVVVPSLFIFSILLLGFALYFFARTVLQKELLILNRFRSRFRLADIILKTSQQSITRWLSLLENSPSISFKA